MNLLSTMSYRKGSLMATMFGEFLKRKVQERKQAKAKQLAYTDAVKKIKILQIEKKCVADELISISDFMRTTEQQLGVKNV